MEASPDARHMRISGSQSMRPNQKPATRTAATAAVPAWRIGARRREPGSSGTAAFLLFHRVFFAQGNFTFDPRTQRLVQLLPDQFWTESLTVVAFTGFAIAVLVTLLAHLRGSALARR